MGLFQTPTGRLIHSNLSAWEYDCSTDEFQTPTGRLIHSNYFGILDISGDEPVSNPNGPPHPFQLGVDSSNSNAALIVSNPNGPPHPFQPVLLKPRPSNSRSFKPQRAASSIPTCIEATNDDCFWRFKPQRAASSIPTEEVMPWHLSDFFVSNPNGPPHPFQLSYCSDRAAVLECFKPQRAASSIPTANQPAVRL